MSGHTFYVKDEDERTPSRDGKQCRKYRRGHYDMVVFNPEFLKKCSFNLAKGQNYELFKRRITGLIDSIEEPPILVGIEFMYNRVPFPTSKSVDRWCNAVLQDYKKLMASKNPNHHKYPKHLNGKPFMKEIVMMPFAIGSKDRIKQAENCLPQNQEIILCSVEI
jgi:AAA15 family ATPase/GTPase